MVPPRTATSSRSPSLPRWVRLSKRSLVLAKMLVDPAVTECRPWGEVLFQGRRAGDTLRNPRPFRLGGEMGKRVGDMGVCSSSEAALRSADFERAGTVAGSSEVAEGAGTVGDFSFMYTKARDARSSETLARRGPRPPSPALAIAERYSYRFCNGHSNARGAPSRRNVLHRTSPAAHPDASSSACAVCRAAQNSTEFPDPSRVI
mmetsp:Transcript_10902/g.30613  ORF Transcript_10902/g.30613 Transcript_10902/m.30613 type:complete len:204 (+) Transcript_10902:1368-1979(+)